MPRNSRNPIILDDLLTINARDIMQKAKQDRNMLLRWYRNGEMIAGIHCEIEDFEGMLVAHFKYHAHDHPVHVRVDIDTIASNLGIGRIPFFVCPISGRRCRKLYLVQGKLVSASAIQGAMYECQTRSKKYRILLPLFDRPFKLERLRKQIQSPYFKPKYRNNPTRTLKQIAEKIATLQQSTTDAILKDFGRNRMG